MYLCSLLHLSQTADNSASPLNILTSASYFGRQLHELSEYWRSKAEEKVLSTEWETGSATLPDSEMLSLLMTALQAGKLTAVTWLVHTITPPPRRFPNSKALAAYCGLDPGLKVCVCM